MRLVNCSWPTEAFVGQLTNDTRLRALVCSGDNDSFDIGCDAEINGNSIILLSGVLQTCGSIWL
jgi:hypothetical protein